MKLPHDELGEGSAVLLLHAGIADRHMWDEHLEPLAAAGHRVVAVDLPGFGDAVPGSGAVAHWDDVLETMEALEIGGASLVGNSFGAAVALRVAAVAPQRIRSLALFSTVSVPEPDPSPELSRAWEAEEEALERNDFEGAVRAVVSAWVRPQASDGVRERIAAMQGRNYRLHAEEDSEWAPDPLEEDPAMLSAIRCPVLIAAGEDDLPDFRRAVADLAAKLSRVTTAVIPACGHLSPLEAPQEFRRLVIENVL